MEHVIIDGIILVATFVLAVLCVVILMALVRVFGLRKR